MTHLQPEIMSTTPTRRLHQYRDAPEVVIMLVVRSDGPYIWITWLTRLLGGVENCMWVSWFKTQFDSKSWARAERVDSLARWKIGHTDMLNRKAWELRGLDYEVTREDLNHFTVNTRELSVKVPAWSECQFCDTSVVHCPERVEQPDRALRTLDRL